MKAILSPNLVQNCQDVAKYNATPNTPQLNLSFFLKDFVISFLLDLNTTNYEKDEEDVLETR